MKKVVSPPPVIPSPPTALERAIHRYEHQTKIYHYEKATGQPGEIAEARASHECDGQHLERERIRITTQAQLQHSLEDYRAASKQKTKEELQAEPHHPARVLARHLTAVGEPNPSSGHQPHHIIAGKGCFMPDAMEQARLALHMHGIGINDAINGVWLPCSTADKNKDEWATPASPAHQEIHRQNYEAWIWRLFGASLLPEKVVRQRLKIVKLKLRFGGYPSYIVQPIVQPEDPQWRGTLMSDAYLLKDMPERFYGSSIAISELAKQLGGADGILERLFLRPHQNEAMASYWGSVTDHWMKRSARVREKPDICLWGSGCLLLNLRAYQALHAPLGGHGEFLPITVGHDPGYVFNCLTWGQEDMCLTENQYVDGCRDGIATLAFEPDDIATKLVFKSKLAGAGLLFASPAFRELVEGHQLQGLRFDPELMDPF